MAITKQEIVERYPHYRLDSNQYPISRRRSHKCVEQPSDELVRTLFAPDPVTGVPRSDIAIVMSKDTSPEVSQYIRDTLMRPLPASSSCGDDADFALESVKSESESLTEYCDRLFGLVNNSNSK